MDALMAFNKGLDYCLEVIAVLLAVLGLCTLTREGKVRQTDGGGLVTPKCNCCPSAELESRRLEGLCNAEGYVTRSAGDRAI